MENFIYGRNPIIEALRVKRPLNKLLISKGARGVFDVIGMAKNNGVNYEFVERSVLDRVCRNTKHQGVLAYVSAAGYIDIEDIMAEAAQKSENPFIVILDGIEDPHNFGAIIRTSDCAGAHGIVFPKRRAAPVTQVVAKTSAGAVEHVKIARVANINDTIRRLKEQRVWVVGLDENAEMEYTKADFKLSTAIVLGGEGKGLPDLVKRNCDFLVKIPMKGSVHSLNASVAAAVVMYELLRQRAS